MSYATISLRDEHRPELLKLWAENMSDSRIASVLNRRFDWLYRENPEGAAETRVAIDQDAGALVGCGSVFPRRICVGGVELRAGVPVDFAVARAHRLGGAALGIQRALIGGQSFFDFFLGFPNKASEPILRRVGYRPVASAHAWVKPLSAAYKLEPFVGPGAPARWLSAPVNVAMAVNDWRHALGARKAGSQIVDRADHRFDQLWQRAKGAYAVAGERTSAYLNWRYGSFTTTAHRFFCLTDADQILGYVAFSVREQKAFVADVFAADIEATAELLMLRFSEAMRREDMQSVFVSYAGNLSFGQRLEQIGFFPRGDQGRKLVAFLTPRASEHQSLILDAKNWIMFDGEMDI